MGIRQSLVLWTVLLIIEMSPSLLRDLKIIMGILVPISVHPGEEIKLEEANWLVRLYSAETKKVGEKREETPVFTRNTIKRIARRSRLLPEAIRSLPHPMKSPAIGTKYVHSTNMKWSIATIISPKWAYSPAISTTKSDSRTSKVVWRSGEM